MLPSWVVVLAVLLGAMWVGLCIRGGLDAVARALLVRAPDEFEDDDDEEDLDEIVTGKPSPIPGRRD